MNKISGIWKPSRSPHDDIAPLWFQGCLPGLRDNDSGVLASGRAASGTAIPTPAANLPDQSQQAQMLQDIAASRCRQLTLQQIAESRCYQLWIQSGATVGYTSNNSGWVCNNWSSTEWGVPGEFQKQIESMAPGMRPSLCQTCTLNYILNLMRGVCEKVAAEKADAEKAAQKKMMCEIFEGKAAQKKVMQLSKPKSTLLAEERNGVEKERSARWQQKPLSLPSKLRNQPKSDPTAVHADVKLISDAFFKQAGQESNVAVSWGHHSTDSYRDVFGHHAPVVSVVCRTCEGPQK